MASLKVDAQIAERALCELAALYPPAESTRTIPISDRERGQFLLLDEGWNGYQRIYNVWAHVELADGKFHIHEDGTEKGIANVLLAAGVPRERIVLSFLAPTHRAASDFAAA
jgi:hypothetical protein